MRVEMSAAEVQEWLCDLISQCSRYCPEGSMGPDKLGCKEHRCTVYKRYHHLKKQLEGFTHKAVSM